MVNDVSKPELCDDCEGSDCDPSGLGTCERDDCEREREGVYTHSLYVRLTRALYAPGSAEPSPNPLLSGQEQADLQELYQFWERLSPEDLASKAESAAIVLGRIGA